MFWTKFYQTKAIITTTKNHAKLKHNGSVKINRNSIWPYIPDHPYIILIINGSVLAKTNSLLNLMKHQRPDIEKTYLCAKDPFESKYNLFISWKRRDFISEAFIDYSQTIDNVYQNLNDYNPTKKIVESVWWYKSRHES